MKKRKLIFVIALLAGCGHGELDPNYVFGGNDLAETDNRDASVNDATTSADLVVALDLLATTDLAALDGSVPADLAEGDHVGEVDLAQSDLAIIANDFGNPDLADGGSDGGDLGQIVIVMPDMAKVPPDIAMTADLLVPDLVVASDMALAAPSDISMVSDLSTPPDLAVSPDMLVARDFTIPSDFSPPPDLAPAPTCVDGAKNQDETDIDCGGATCPKCADTKTCAAPADCLSANCADTFNGKVCVPSYTSYYKITIAGNATEMWCVERGTGNTVKKPIKVGTVERTNNLAFCFAVDGAMKQTAGVVGMVCTGDAMCRMVCDPVFNNNQNMSGFCITKPGTCGGNFCPAN